MKACFLKFQTEGRFLTCSVYAQEPHVLSFDITNIQQGRSPCIVFSLYTEHRDIHVYAETIGHLMFGSLTIGLSFIPR